LKISLFFLDSIKINLDICPIKTLGQHKNNKTITKSKDRI